MEIKGKLILNYNIVLRKKIVRCYVWSIALYGSQTWALRELSTGIWRVSKCNACGEDKMVRGSN